MPRKIKITNRIFYRVWLIFMVPLLLLFWIFGVYSEPAILSWVYFAFTPLLGFLMFNWIRAFFRVKEVYYIEGEAFIVEHRGSEIQVPLSQVEQILQQKRPKGMPAKVILKEIFPFGKFFYFSPHLAWEKDRNLFFENLQDALKGSA